jgi:glutathione peroxidase
MESKSGIRKGSRNTAEGKEYKMGFYDITVKNAQGEEVSMGDFRGKVVVVVNTATGCGFTPHYEPLEKMYEDLHDKGLEIVDVPCNQFAGQTPGTDEEIHEFCTLKYNTQFPQMAKADVNGENAIPLFTYLKSQKGFEGFGKSPAALAMSVMLKGIDKDYKKNPDIKWNFTKFVVNREGEVVARFEPTASMDDVRKCVESLI